MKEKKDNLILENLYQENIWDRLKGTGAGLKAGASTLGQNFKNKAISALGGTPTTTTSGSAGQSYAKAQQSSLLKSFQGKIKKEIEDFKNDLKTFKVDPDQENFSNNFPTIAQKLKELENLETFLANPSATPTAEPAPTAEATPEPTKDVLNSDEASSYLGISKEELFKKAQSGEISGIKLGAKGYIFPKQNIIKAKQGVSSSPEPAQTPATLGSTPQTTTQPKGKAEKQVILDTDLDTTYQFINNSWYPRTGSKKDGFNYGEKISDKNLINQLETEWKNENQGNVSAPLNSTPPATKPAVKKPTTKPVVKPAVKKPVNKKQSKPLVASGKIKGSQVQARRAGNMSPAELNALQRTSESFNVFGEFLKENNLI